MNASWLSILATAPNFIIKNNHSDGWRPFITRINNDKLASYHTIGIGNTGISSHGVLLINFLGTDPCTCTNWAESFSLIFYDNHGTFASNW
jgi:hypothetical protein